MKKIICVLMIMMLSATLSGCLGNSTKKQLEEVKSILEVKEYEKALSLLELVLEKDEDNEEAIALYSIIDSFQKAKKLIEEDKIEEAEKILKEINFEYSQYAIKEDIDSLNVKVDEYNEEVAKVKSSLAEAEKLFNDGKYEECRAYLEANIESLDKDEIEANKYINNNMRARLLEIYKECGEGIARIEAEKVAKEEELAAAQNNNVNSNSSSIQESSSQQNNTQVDSSQGETTQQPSVDNNSAVSPTPPSEVVPDDSTNPYTYGIKNINGFTYLNNYHEYHWYSDFYYQLTFAGMYNQIVYENSYGKVSGVIYYSDDSAFYDNYQSIFETSYGAQYFGEYNGREVRYIYEFNY